MSFVLELFGNYRAAWHEGGTSARWFLTGGFIFAARILAFTVAFPLYAKEKGFDSGQIGLMLGAVAMSLVIFGMPVARLGAKGHTRSLLIGGPLVSAAGIAIVLATPGNLLFPSLVGCLLSGMASTAFWTLGDPMLARSVPSTRRSHVYALKFALLTAGFGIGGVLSGWIPEIASVAGANDLRALAASLLFVMMLDVAQTFCYFHIPNPKTGTAGPTVREAHQRARFHGWAMWAVLAMMLVPEMGMAAGFHAIRPYMSLFYEERFGLASGTTGTIIGIMQLCGGIGALLIPSLALRIGNVQAMALLRILGGTAIALALGVSSLPIVVGLFFFQYSITDGTEATFVTEAMTRLPELWRTTFSAVAAIVWSISAAIAASVSGYLQDRTGDFDAGFAYGVCGLFLSAGWLLLVYPRIPVLYEESASEVLVQHGVES